MSHNDRPTDNHTVTLYDAQRLTRARKLTGSHQTAQNETKNKKLNRRRETAQRRVDIVTCGVLPTVALPSYMLLSRLSL